MSNRPAVLGMVRRLIAGAGCALCLTNAAASLVSSKPSPGAFALTENNRSAALVVSTNDFPVVQIASRDLATDLERVTGSRPVIFHQLPTNAPAVLIGTLGQSAIIDDLVARGLLDAAALRGQWESFLITTISNPAPGIAHALVIVGSDRRGTAFGVYELSEAIGVSPWHWWADVAPEPKSNLYVAAAARRFGPPSVKYRGIFINDEDWGLQPWAAKTFEPETGDIGPRTYAKVCELLLRLKANYLWPAMHPCTKAFNHYPQNKLVADDYAIVMGSSHCEQMLRNNVTEYDEKEIGPWNYELNRTNILAYWQQRLGENGKFENIYTIGMRGIHDSGMPGGGNIAQKAARLQRVIDDQRELIARTINPDPALVPQIFCPYKEVLPLYQHGVRVPGDVTLVWPDDNHGYIRQLSNAAEQQRSGGAGVYYHLSYWGAPEDYLWLCTTPPALIWEEMHKAWEQAARTVWVVNVGDIKPGEIGMEFFLRLAWDITPWHEDAQPVFLRAWAERNFGPAHAAEIAAILEEYYRLNFACKPEHLHLAQFTKNYGEIPDRLQRFQQLVARTDVVLSALPAAQQDGFYELVAYSVRGAALANQMHLSDSIETAQAAYDQIQVETRRYNETIAGGKWRHIISSNPRNRPALRKPDAKTFASTAPAPANKSNGAAGFIAFEAELPTRANATAGAEWKTIRGLGRSGDSIALLPTTATITSAVALEYDFPSDSATNASVSVYCLPTQPLHSGGKLRFTASVDAGLAQTIDLATAEFSRPWSTNVLRAAAIGLAKFPISQAGKHTLKLQPLDPGLVFDKVVIDFGGLRPTHLGPKPTDAKTE